MKGKKLIWEKLEDHKTKILVSEVKDMKTIEEVCEGERESRTFILCPLDTHLAYSKYFILFLFVFILFYFYLFLFYFILFYFYFILFLFYFIFILFYFFLFFFIFIFY